MKKAFVWLLSAVLLVGLLTGCGNSGAAAPVGEAESGETSPAAPLTIQLAHSDTENEDGIHQKMAVLFAQYVEELSGGAIEIEIVGNGQLGGERDLVEGMQLGTIEMASTANMVLSNFMPEFAVLDLPYMYSDYETAYKVLDSDEMAAVIEKFAQEQGVRVLAYGQGGFRQVIGNRSVGTLADMNGMKIRVPESDIYIDTFTALHANPTPLAYSETFTALQQGTVDGFEIVPAVVLSNGFFEVCSNISITNHLFSPNPLMISESLFSGLTEEQQTILKEAAQQAAAEQRAWLESSNEDVMTRLEEKGMAVDHPDLAEFQAAVDASGLYDTYKETIGADLVESIQALCQ